jgi:hypothetical protein
MSCISTIYPICVLYVHVQISFDIWLKVKHVYQGNDFLAFHFNTGTGFESERLNEEQL